jgi:hypothetical protein
MTAPCATCGYPKYRADAHASWCERVTAALRASDAFGVSARTLGGMLGGLVKAHGPERGRALYAERIAARQVAT